MVHIYYGMGKGKTSTLNGSALRANGAGLKVLVVRFLKGRPTSEDAQLEKLGIKVIRAQLSHKFVMQMDPSERLITKDETLQAIKFIQLNAEDYDLIIMDEFLDLAAKNVDMFTPKQLFDIVDPLKSEVMISGHTHVDTLFERADLITKYEPEKHYFDKGVQARKGIEY